MHSDWNSFCGDVVFHNVYMASRNEGDILDQIYKSKYVFIFIIDDLNFYDNLQNTY